jgi:hypothetical protein
MKANQLQFYCIFLGLIFISSCKTVVEKVEFDTEMIVHTFNDQNQPIDSANVAIFDDFQKYKTAILTYDFSQSISTGYSKGGNMKFDGLAPNVTYYVASYYKDKNKIPGTLIAYDNSEINYQIAIKLRKGSINEVDIQMKPASGVVTFLAPESQKSRFPLTVKFNNSNAGVITKAFVDMPLTLADSTVHVNAKKGKGYYVVTSSVCSWYGETTVIGGERTSVSLAPCEAGKIAFFVEDTATANYPVKITLNNNDALPNLDKTKANEVTDCNTPNAYFVEKGIGTYTYSARSANGKCVWTGQITVSNDECSIVKLAKCR